jgi:hypothetical protein
VSVSGNIRGSVRIAGSTLMLMATLFAASAYYKTDHLVGTERVTMLKTLGVLGLVWVAGLAIRLSARPRGDEPQVASQKSTVKQAAARPGDGPIVDVGYTIRLPQREERSTKAGGNRYPNSDSRPTRDGLH